ncbi:TPA: hypothetical protein ACGNDF_001513 [Streptococcus agalactiae]
MTDLFKEDEKQELKAVIVKFLESVIYGEDINVTVDDDGVFAEYIVEVYVDQGSDFSLYRDELIADKILTKEEIVDWYYEEQKDFVWRDDYLTFNIDTLTDDISDAFPDKEYYEIDKYVSEQVELQGDVDLTEVFDRIYSDCNDSLEREFGEGITFELLAKNKEVYDMITDYSEYVWVAKDLKEAEAFDYINYVDLAKAITESPNSVVRRNLLNEFCQDGNIDDYDEDEFFDFVYDKVREDDNKDLFESFYDDNVLVEYFMEDNYVTLPNGKILFCSYF